MAKPYVSVVIPAYNEEEAIAPCLESLVQQQTTYPFEVIVVDNNSTDKTAKVASSFAKKLDMHVIHEKKKGRGAARARGFEAAQGEIIFSTDADSVMPRHWIQQFTDMLSDPEIVAVTGTGKIDDNGWYKNTLFNFFQPMAMRSYRIFMRHYWLSGFSFAIRKDVYEKAGRIDPTLNALDDLDLGFRVMKKGKIKFAPNAPVVMSGRRFRGNFTGGLVAYFKPFLFVARQQKHRVYMDDVR